MKSQPCIPTSPWWDLIKNLFSHLLRCWHPKCLPIHLRNINKTGSHIETPETPEYVYSKLCVFWCGFPRALNLWHDVLTHTRYCYSAESQTPAVPLRVPTCADEAPVTDWWGTGLLSDATSVASLCPSLHLLCISMLPHRKQHNSFVV